MVKKGCMKWIGSYFLAFLCLIHSPSYADLSQDDCTIAQINLIKYEISYAQFLLYEASVDRLPKDFAIDWVSEVLQIALEDLDELEKDFIQVN